MSNTYNNTGYSDSMVESGSNLLEDEIEYLERQLIEAKNSNDTKKADYLNQLIHFAKIRRREGGKSKRKRSSRRKRKTKRSRKHHKK